MFIEPVDLLLSVGVASPYFLQLVHSLDDLSLDSFILEGAHHCSRLGGLAVFRATIFPLLLGLVCWIEVSSRLFPLWHYTCKRDATLLCQCVLLFLVLQVVVGFFPSSSLGSRQEYSFAVKFMSGVEVFSSFVISQQAC